jgi:hypothetical protein
VINSLAPFDPVSELLPLNILITLSIAAAQKVLLDRDIEVAQKEKLSKTVVVLPFNREDVFEQAVLKERIERQIQKKIKRMDLSRIDEELNQITYTIYH